MSVNSGFNKEPYDNDNPWPLSVNLQFLFVTYDKFQDAKMFN